MGMTLDNFLNTLPACRTEEKAGQFLLSFFQEMGAEGGNIWFASGRNVAKSKNACVSDYPKSHLEWMYESVPYNELETAKLASRQYTPIRIGWDYDQYRYDKGSLDYEYTRTTRHETGIRNAIVIPVPTVGKTGASGVSFFSRSSAKSFDGLISERGDAVRLAGYATHVHIQSLNSQSPRNQCLSKRERECLLWLSRGLRTKEISHKLNLRDVTVNLHITNAKRKLNATTRGHAVAIAILSSAIDP